MKTTIVALLILLSACTENQRTRAYGGHLEVRLPNCQRLVTASWKIDGNLWYLTEPMGSLEPRATVYREKSDFGVAEGTVTFRESCDRPQDDR